MAPVVSVILPVHNAAATLGAALDSLHAQTFRDFEIVAVDDGSADASAALLEHHAARVRLVRQPHLGLVAALNRGIAEARGEFIARMDADDVCHPERFARQIAHLRSNDGVGLVACRVRFGGDAAAAAGYLRHVEFSNAQLTHEQIALARFRESPLAHPSVVFRRSLTDRFGGYRAGSFPEDYELWLRWLEHGVRMEKLPDVLLTWNDPPQRLSRTHSNYSIENFHAVKAAYLARWLAANNPHHPRILVIGAGRVTRRRVDFLRAQGIQIEAWADIDRSKAGRILDGTPVLQHDALPSPSECFIVPHIGNIGAADFIRDHLEARGFIRGVSYIEAA